MVYNDRYLTAVTEEKNKALYFKWVNVGYYFFVCRSTANLDCLTTIELHITCYECKTTPISLTYIGAGTSRMCWYLLKMCSPLSLYKVRTENGREVAMY